MSLEEALNKNTAMMAKHNELLEKMLAGGDKPAGKPADKPAGKPAATPAKTPPKTTTSKTKGDPTVEDVTERVTAFLKTGDKDTRDERKAQVKTIIDHYGADRFTTLDPSNFTEALGFLKQYEDGEMPDFGNDDGSDNDGSDGDEGESMV